MENLITLENWEVEEFVINEENELAEVIFAGCGTGCVGDIGIN